MTVGRSKRGRGARQVTDALLAVVVLVAAMALGACATSPPSRSELVGALRSSGIPPAEARCVVRAVFNTLSPEQIEQLYERGNGGVPRNDPTRGNDASDRLSASVGTCRDQAIANPPVDGPTGPDGSTATAPNDQPTTSGPAFVPSDGSSGVATPTT